MLLRSEERRRGRPDAARQIHLAAVRQILAVHQIRDDRPERLVRQVLRSLYVSDVLAAVHQRTVPEHPACAAGNYPGHLPACDRKLVCRAEVLRLVVQPAVSRLQRPPEALCKPDAVPSAASPRAAAQVREAQEPLGPSVRLGSEQQKLEFRVPRVLPLSVQEEQQAWAVPQRMQLMLRSPASPPQKVQPQQEPQRASALPPRVS